MCEVKEAKSRVSGPGEKRNFDDLLKIEHPILMRKGLHEVRLEKVVSLVIFQDRCKIKEALFVVKKPSDIHDPHVDLCIFRFRFSTATEERFFGNTFVDILLYFFQI